MANTIFLGKSYKFSLIVMVVILLLLWIFGKKKKYPFIGFTPLLPESNTEKVPYYYNRDDCVSMVSGDSGSSKTSTVSKKSRKSSERGSKKTVVPSVPETISTSASNDTVSDNAPKYQLNLIDSKCFDYSDIKKTGKESKGEAICRAIFEKIFNAKFPNCRPDFLVNPLTGCNLEIDGYCAEKKLAWEFNGIQHYEKPNFFHKTREEFEAQQARDRYKIEACKKSGIDLIVIPYHIPYNDLHSFIMANIPARLLR